MTEALVADFGAALEALDVTLSRTASDTFEPSLEGVIERPAVGAPLPYDPVSLAGTGVVVNPTPAELTAAATGVTGAGLGIAEYGTVMIQSRPGGDEPVSLYPPRHVAVLRQSDIVPGIAEAIDWLGSEFESGRDSVVFATGASATADMGELVRGVHGPGEVHVLLLEDL